MAAAATESAPSANERRLESALAVERERYLRLRADLDNFRKRAERERAEVERYAGAEVARELLPVVDNLERALAAVPGEGDDLRRGVEMILRQLEEILRRLGVTKVASLGERFDPSHHEAVMHEESEEVEVPTVVAELQRGYRLNDRLLRPAMVKVAMPADDAGQAPDAE
jgi:molecular chaperone GrpE